MHVQLARLREMAISPGESGHSAATTVGVSSLANQGARPDAVTAIQSPLTSCTEQPLGSHSPLRDLPSEFSRGVLPDRNLCIVRYSFICWKMPRLYVNALGSDNYQLLSSQVLRLAMP